MPSLYGAGVRIHLASHPLAPTLTEKIQLKKGHDAAAKLHHAEKALQESVRTLLPEERVPFPGDDGKLAVNWLGSTPFLQAVVGQPSERSQQLENMEQRVALSKGHTPSSNSRRSSQGLAMKSDRLVSPKDSEDKKSHSFEELAAHGLLTAPSPYTLLPNKHQEAKALILHVMLTNKTFYQDPFDSSPQHLKIDVFLNGQLSSSVLIHAGDIRMGVKSLNQVFAGTRIDFMAERPWVIHAFQPHFASGSPSQVAPGTSAQNRWAEISEALMSEVKERGVDVNGERPPTATYLKDLASMQMPDMVRNLQKTGELKFGVIDVIITAGSGKKTVSNVVYLKAPTRLSDDRFCYEMEESSDSESDQAGASTTRPSALQSSEQDAQGDSGLESTGMVSDSTCHGLSASSSQELPLPPPRPALPWHNPFTGSPIPPLSSLGSSTSFVRQSFSLPGSSEPPQKRACLIDAPISHGNGFRIESNDQQMLPLPRSYPSAHSPSVPPRNSYALSIPDTGFNVNQYDSFEHANPYQLPYTGMMNGLDLASLDGPAPSQLRNDYGGHLTLPSFTPALEEVFPSPAATSAFPSPYSQTSVPISQVPAAVFASDHSTSYSSVVPPMRFDISSPGHLLHSSLRPGYDLQGPSRSSLLPLGAPPRPFSPYASIPYMPPPRRSSNGPPPPMGLFKVTEKPKGDIPTKVKAAAQESSERSTVRRLVIRMGARVIVSHLFTGPRQLLDKPSLTIDTSLRPGLSEKARNRVHGSAERLDQEVVPRGSNKADDALTTPPDTSPNEHFDHTSTTSLDKTKRDSIHDGLTSTATLSYVDTASTPVVKGSGEASEIVAVDMAGSTMASSDSYIYAPMHRTAETGILGVQGPKANLFVFDNPEELLRKKKPRTHAQSRSTSPTKVDTQGEIPAEQTQATEARKADHLVKSTGADTGLSSPLSELSHSPQLSITAETNPRTDTNSPANMTASPPPTTLAVPNTKETTATPRTSNPLSTPAKVPQAPHAPSMFPPSLPSPASGPVTVKRKRAPEPTPKRTSARAYVKQPRSPGRLNAKDNPPLNRDCVIQFAVSEREGGALRQVKSERRGVFKENSVVVGCRFFVGGC